MATEEEFIPPSKFAFSTLQMLLEQPARYRNYGVYWFFVKALLKEFYTKENLYLLGDYMNPAVIAMMPEHKNLQEALRATMETYNNNATWNMNSPSVTAPDGEQITLYDEDVGL